MRAEMEAWLVGEAENHGPAPLNADDADVRVEGGATELRPTLLDETSVSEGPGTVIGRYKLLQKIGEGGCGVVYMAEQEEPIKRRVALKVIKLGMDTRQVVARFEAERQALALMDHPNIAKVLDGGTTEGGRPFFVMELVKGIPITRYCDEHRLDTTQRLELFILVCQAVQHAHQKGIVHRDIKPSNILVADHEGVPVPKVIDFGIAKATAGQTLTDKTLFTAFEQFIGTPAYMSPEQAELSGLDIDTRSDIYSLGVLLYELLTGKTPFDAKRLVQAGIEGICHIIREEEPPRPSTRLIALDAAEQTTLARQRQIEPPKWVHLIRGDLDWIVMKCLEKDRNRRYETANGLARDIERHLTNEPVVARPASMGYRLQKSFRRNKLLFTAAGVVGLALVLGVLVSSWQAIRATKAVRREAEARLRADEAAHVADGQRQRAEKGEQKARESELAAREKAYASDMNLAQQALQESNLGRVRDLLLRHQPQPGGRDLRGWEWRYLWKSCGSDELFTLGHHSNVIEALAFSPDGKRLATGGFDKLVKIWDLETRREIGSAREETMLGAVAFSADGKQLLTANLNATVKICDLERLPDLAPRVLGMDIGSYLVISPDGKTLACTGGDSLQLWDLSTRQEVHRARIEGHSWRAAFDPRGDTLAIGTVSGEIVLWDVQKRSQLSTFSAHQGHVLALAFSPGGQFLASGGWDHLIRIWAFPSGRLVTNLTAHASMVNSVAFSPDGRTLASASRDQTVRLWDVSTWQEKAILRGHLNEVWAVAFSPDGQTLATSGKDETIKLWSAAAKGRGNLAKTLPRDFRACSDDGRALLSVDREATATVWDCAELKETAKFKVNLSEVFRVALSAGGTQAAFADRTGSILVWDIASGRIAKRLQAHTGEVINTVRRAANVALVFSPDIQTLAVAGGNGGINVWRLANPEEVFSFSHSGTALMTIALSPGAQFLAAGDSEGTVEVWNLSSRKSADLFLGHKQGIRAIRFYKDTLVTASWDATVRLWNLSTGKQIISLGGQLLAFESLAISPDMQRLAGGGADGSLKIWELRTFQELATLKGHRDSVFGLGFSKDGNTLVSLGNDGNIIVRRAPTFAEIEAAEKTTEGKPL